MGISIFQADLCIYKTPLQISCLCKHNTLCPLSMPICNFVIMRHAFLHLFQLPCKTAGAAMKHHKNRWRAKGPAAFPLDADGSSGHLCTCAAMKLTHFGNIVIHKKAHNKVAFPQKVSLFFPGPVRMLLNRLHKQFF